MQCNTLSHNKCGGKNVAYVVKIKGSNLTNSVFVVNNGKLTEYFPM